MNKNICLTEKFMKLGFALFFLSTAIAFIVSAFTVLPFFGFIFAIPAVAASFYFLTVHLNDRCQIE